MAFSRVLVTGANGLLGSNIVAELINRGYPAVAMVRKNSNRLALADLHCEIFEGDVTRFSDLEQAISRCNYVIHCAASTNQRFKQLKKHEAINIYSTAFLIELSKKQGIKRFIYVSTANCFTNGNLQHPGNEEGGFMPWLKSSGYAYSKYLAQQLVLNEAKQSDFPAIVVAPTFMIGSRDSKPSSGKLLLYGLKKQILFYPPGGKSFVDVTFVADAIVNALDKGNQGESYLLSGINLSYRSFFKLVQKVHHRPQLLLPVPKAILVALATFFDFIGTVFPVSLPLNRVNQRLLCLDNYFSSEKAQAELGFKPTELTTAITRATEWFKTNNYL